jgi:hypothetical protein
VAEGIDLVAHIRSNGICATTAILGFQNVSHG